MTKEQAIIKILKVLNSRMAIMSKPMRDEALTLAEEYGITVAELIEEWTKIKLPETTLRLNSTGFGKNYGLQQLRGKL